MSRVKELIQEINNDTIDNENFIICLQSENLRIVGMAIFKMIERNYCDRRIVNRLSELSKLMNDSKFIGPWQFGHVAIATLLILDNEDARSKGNEIFNKLSETDKFLVNNFIQSESYKL